MSRKSKIYLAAFAAAIIVCAGGIALLQLAPKQEIAQIYLDGELVQELHWGALTAPQEIPIGDGNILCADGDGVWMKSADCPDQLCVKQGKIHNGSRSIVCLPNRVTVTLKSAEPGLDGVAG